MSRKTVAPVSFLRHSWRGRQSLYYFPFLLVPTLFWIWICGICVFKQQFVPSSHQDAQHRCLSESGHLAWQVLRWWWYRSHTLHEWMILDLKSILLCPLLHSYPPSFLPFIISLNSIIIHEAVTMSGFFSKGGPGNNSEYNKGKDFVAATPLFLVYFQKTGFWI